MTIIMLEKSENFIYKTALSSLTVSPYYSLLFLFLIWELGHGFWWADHLQRERMSGGHLVNFSLTITFSKSPGYPFPPINPCWFEVRIILHSLIFVCVGKDKLTKLKSGFLSSSHWRWKMEDNNKFVNWNIQAKTG